MYVIQHCFICRPSDSTVSEDARIEPRTVVTLALTVTRLDLIQLICKACKTLSRISAVSLRHLYRHPFYPQQKSCCFFGNFVGHALKKIIYIKLTFSTRHWPAAGLYILTEFFSSLQNRGNIKAS